VDKNFYFYTYWEEYDLIRVYCSIADKRPIISDMFAERIFLNTFWLTNTMLKYYNSRALCLKIHEAPDFSDKSAAAGFYCRLAPVWGETQRRIVYGCSDRTVDFSYEECF